MTFLERSEDIKEKLKKIKELQGGVEEAQSLNDDAKELEGLNNKLNELINLIKIAKEKEIRFVLPDNQNLIEKATGLQQRFSENPIRRTLTSNKRLITLITDIKDIYEQIKKILQDAWVRFVEDNYPIAKPDELNTQIAQTDENIKQLAEYKKTYLKIEPLLRIFPYQMSIFIELDTLKKQLEDIKTKIDFNVPEEVKRFLDDISNQGASLDHLTNPIVIKWLTDNKMMDRYKIIRKQT